MITDEEFLRISAYMKQHYGIDLSQKKVIVNGRLEKHIKGGGWRNFNDFMDAVEKEPSGVQAKTLVNLLTTNHTYFMREFEHFDYFKGVVLPWIKKKENARKDVRIWCGAASTGEEPYMIAMVLSDFFGLDRSHWDTKLLATDISTKVLKQAIAGVYTADKLEKLPPAWKKHFFQDMGGGQYRVKEELKKEVQGLVEYTEQFQWSNPLVPYEASVRKGASCAGKSLRERGGGRQAKKRLKRRAMTRTIYENPQKSSFHFPEFTV